MVRAVCMCRLNSNADALTESIRKLWSRCMMTSMAGPKYGNKRIKHMAYSAMQLVQAASRAAKWRQLPVLLEGLSISDTMRTGSISDQGVQFAIATQWHIGHGL